MKELEKILEEIESDESRTLSDLKSEISQRSVNEMRKYVQGLRRAKNIVRKHMNDGWIPVEERLPERSGERQIGCYEVTILNGRHLVTTAAYDYADRKWLTKSKVIAWRPLPEPYHPERSNDAKE